MILNKTITLFNYAGEKEKEAVYKKTVLSHVYFFVQKGANESTQGKKSNDNARLYIFHHRSKAYSENGCLKNFMIHSEWENSIVQDLYWTLSCSSKDYFVLGECPNKIPPVDAFKIISVNEKVAGTRRMHHWEIDGK